MFQESYSLKRKERLQSLDPRKFKILIRLKQLRRYNFQRVFWDLLEMNELHDCIQIAYGLKYAVGQGLFKLPTLKNESQTLKNGKIGMMIYQKILKNDEEEIEKLLSENGVQGNKIILNSHSYGKVDIVLQKQIDMTNNITQQNEINSIKIKCMQKVIQEEEIQQNNEDETKNIGFEKSFWFFESYFKVFQTYLLKSQETMINNSVINGDILSCINYFRLGTKFSKVSNNLLDQIALFLMCIQIVYNQVFIHNQTIDPKLFVVLIQKLINIKKDLKMASFQLNKSSLQYYVNKNYIYSKFQMYDLVKILQKKFENQGKFTQLFFFDSLEKTLTDIKIKMAQIVSQLVGTRPKKYGQYIKKYLEALSQEQKIVKQQLWNIFVLLEWPISDKMFFKIQFENSLIQLNSKTSMEQKNNRKKGKNYIFAVLNNQKITKDLFTPSFLESMLERLIKIEQNKSDPSSTQKNTLTRYVQILIKNHQSCFNEIISLWTWEYFEYSPKEKSIVQNWILKSINSSKYYPKLTNFFKKLMRFSIKNNSEKEINFLLIAIKQLISRFKLKSQQILEGNEEFWEKCILNQSLFSFSCQNFSLKIEGVVKQKLNISLISTVIIEENKEKFSLDILKLYLKHYSELRSDVKVIAIKILKYFCEKIRPKKYSFSEILESLLYHIETQKQFNRSMSLKQMYYEVYEKASPPKIKQNFYLKTIELFNFYEPTSSQNKSKSIELNLKILNLISEEKTQNLATQLQIIERIISLQSLDSLHHLAFHKATKKIRKQLNPPESLLRKLELFVTKATKMENYRNQIFGLVKSLFILPNQLSKQFLTQIIEYFEQRQQFQNQFVYMVIYQSHQQLQMGYFNFMLQKQLVLKQIKNEEELIKQFELLYESMDRVDKKYFHLLFNNQKHIFERNQQHILYKALKVIQNKRNANLFLIAQKQINKIQVRTIQNCPFFYNFLCSKCEIMGDVSKQTIDLVINSSQRNECLQFYYLISSIIIKNKTIDCNIDLLCRGYQKYWNQRGSDQFTKSLISLIKKRKLSSQNIKSLTHYLFIALKVSRQENIIVNFQFIELFWDHIVKGKYQIQLLNYLNQLARKNLSNVKIKQKFKALIRKFFDKIERKKNSEEKRILEQLNFILTNDKDKMYLSLQMLQKKNIDPIYLDFIVRMLQLKKITQYQLNNLLYVVQKLELPSKKQQFFNLIKRIIKFQISYKQPSAIHKLFQIIGEKIDVFKSQKGIYNLIQKFHSQFQIRSQNQIKRKDRKSTNHEIQFQNDTSFQTKIAFYNEQLPNLWLIFIQKSESLSKRVHEILRHAAMKRKFENFIGIKNFVENLLMIPSLNHSDKNFIHIIEKLIINKHSSKKILHFYRIYLVLYEISKESEAVFEQIYLKISQQDQFSAQSLQVLTAINLIIKRDLKQKNEENLRKQSILLYRLNEISNQNSRKSKIALKCVYSICKNSIYAQLNMTYEINIFHQSLKRFYIERNFFNFSILCGCDKISNCKSLTEIILMDFLEKYEKYCETNQMYPKFKIKENRQQLRFACQFLIQRESSGIPQFILQNQLLFNCLQKLFTKKFFIQDLLLILQLAQVNFEETLQKLALFEKKYPILIIQQNINQKESPFLEEQSELLQLFGLYNSLNIVQKIQNQLQTQQIIRVGKYLCSQVNLDVQGIKFDQIALKDIKNELVLKAFETQIIKNQNKDRILTSLRGLIKKILQNQSFETFFKIILERMSKYQDNQNFCESLEVFCDYIASNFEVSLINFKLIGESPSTINNEYIRLKGKSHKKDLKEILIQLKEQKNLSKQEIEGLQQYLQNFHQILSNHQQLKFQQKRQKRYQSKQSYWEKQESFRNKGYEKYYYYKQKFLFKAGRFFSSQNYYLLKQIAFYYGKVWKQTGKTLRQTQIVAIWIALNSLLKKKKSSILQVCTGQGKSLIIVGIAAILGRKSFTVDIVTSSPVLAIRDRQLFQKLFNSMGLQCSHNIDDPLVPYEEGVKKCYKFSIIYGTCIQFSFDWLRHNYSRLNTKGYRSQQNTYLIVDQADNCMIDDMFYVARLADSFSGAQSLLPLYYQIWSCFQQLIKRMIQIEGKFYLVKGLIQINQQKLTLQYIQEQNGQKIFISDLERQIKTEIQNGRSVNSLPFVITSIQDKDHIEFVKQRMQQSILYMLDNFEYLWSAYAKNYAKNHIKIWIQSLIIAERMNENVDYKITKNKAIKVVDYLRTGIVQSNTSLSHAVHQFLQCKHRCPLTLQTRTTNFLSYYSLFKIYKNRIIGLTGTIGDQKTQKKFSQIYQATCYRIPKFMTDMIQKIPSKVCENYSQWIEKIAKTSISQAKKGRAVLIVCLTIQIGEKIGYYLRQIHQKELVSLYLSNQQDDEPRVCRKGQIIVATNLAGRGTDINTDQEVESCGGLDVILTYNPDSDRVQMQIMGRTSRNGKLGTFRRIVLSNKIINDSEIKSQNQKYSQNIMIQQNESKNLKRQIQIINLEDDLFSSYNKWLIKVRRQNTPILKTKFKVTKSEVIISQIQDRFSELISSIQTEITSNIISIENLKSKAIRQLQNIKNSYNNYKNSQGKQKYFFTNGCYLLRLANAHLQSFTQNFKLLENPYELKIFLDLAEQTDPDNFNVYYLKAYYFLRGIRCIFTLNDHIQNYKELAMKQLSTAKKKLQNEMSGYEIITMDLMRRKQQDGKMYKQFGKKLEICYQCLQSIQRMQNTIRMSYCPVQLIIKQKNHIKKYSIIQRYQARLQLQKLNEQMIEMKCLRIGEQNIKYLLDKDNEFLITGEGPISQIKQSFNKILLSENDFGFKYAQISNVCKVSDLNQLFNHIRTQEKEVYDEYQKTQFILEMEKKNCQLQQINQFSSQILTITQINANDEQKQDCIKEIIRIRANNTNFNNICELLKNLKSQSSVQIIQIFSSLRTTYKFTQFLQKIVKEKGIQSPVSFQIKDNDFNRNTRAQKYLQKIKLPDVKVKYYGNKGKSLQKLKLLDYVLNKQEKQIDIGSIKLLSQLYPEKNAPHIQIYQMKNRGFQIIFQIKQRKPFPTKIVLILLGIAAAQIILGTLLIMTGAGSTVGAGIITQSLNQFFTIWDVAKTREFSLKSYLIGKAISLTLTAATLGCSSLKNTAKGVQMVAKEAAQIGLTNVIRKSITSQQGNMLSLVGKKILLETGQQIATRTVSHILNERSNHIIEQFRSQIEEKIHQIIIQDGQIMSEVRRIRLLERYQNVQITKLNSHSLNLKQQIIVALNPPVKSPQIVQIIKGLKLISQKLMSNPKTGGSIMTNAIRLAEVASLFANIFKTVNQPISLMKKLLKKKIFNICYPIQSVSIYLDQKGVQGEEKQMIMKEVLEINNMKIKHEKQVSNISNTQKIMTTIGNEILGNHFMQEFFEKQQKIYKASKFHKLTNSDVQKMGIQELQLIEKVMIDFVMEQIKNNFNKRIVSVYVTPLINRNLTNPFTKKLLNKVLASKKQHHQNDIRKYQRLKNSKHLSEGDKKFISQFQNPDVVKQLQAHCRYRSAGLVSRHNTRQLERKKKANDYKRDCAKKEIQRLKNSKNQYKNETQMKIIAKQNGIKIKITRDPNEKLTQEQKSAGYTLILHEEGGFDNKGNALPGHYKKFDEQSQTFADVEQQTQTSCGLDVLRQIIKQKGLNVTNEQLNQSLIKGIQENPQGYSNCKDAQEFLKIQYPKHFKALIMQGGYNHELGLKQRQKFYKFGIHYGYCSEIYEQDNLQKMQKKLQQLKKNPKQMKKFIADIQKSKRENTNIFDFPADFANKTYEQQISFIQNQLKRVNCIKLIQRQFSEFVCMEGINNFPTQQKLKQLQKNFMSGRQLNPDQKKLLHHYLCSKTYNTCCRQQACGLAYLYQNDSRFKGVYQNGDEMRYVGLFGEQTGHQILVITDNNKTNQQQNGMKQYINDPTNQQIQKATNKKNKYQNLSYTQTIKQYNSHWDNNSFNYSHSNQYEISIQQQNIKLQNQKKQQDRLN